MIQFRPATDADADAWQAFLAATGSGDFLHDWAWADVAAFDGQPQRRYVLTDDDTIVALVAAQERPLVAGRAFWYVPHGPVLDWDAPAGGGARSRPADRPAHRGASAPCDRRQARAPDRRGVAGVRAAARAATHARHAPGRADSDRGAWRRRSAAGTLRQGHAVCRSSRRTRGGWGRGGRGRAATRGPSTTSTAWLSRRSAAPASRCHRSSDTGWPGARWPAPDGPPSSRRVATASSSHRAWSSSRARARTTCSAAPAARSAESQSTTPATPSSGR